MSNVKWHWSCIISKMYGVLYLTPPGDNHSIHHPIPQCYIRLRRHYFGQRYFPEQATCCTCIVHFIPAVPWNIFYNLWSHAPWDLLPQIQSFTVWIASWIPFKFCIWLKLRWHDMIKRFEWRSGAESFCELVTTTSAPLHNSTLGLIVEKNICLCQKALTLKDDIFDWCSDRDKSKKPCWDNELVNRDAAAFSAFCFSNIFRCHSFNRFVNKCLSKHWTQLWFMLIFMDKI